MYWNFVVADLAADLWLHLLATAAMSASKTIAHLCAWSGLWLASLVWAVNMQLGQILPYLDCRTMRTRQRSLRLRRRPSPALRAVTSWRVAARPAAANAPRDTFYFVGAIERARRACLYICAFHAGHRRDGAERMRKIATSMWLVVASEGAAYAHGAGPQDGRDLDLRSLDRHATSLLRAALCGWRVCSIAATGARGAGCALGMISPVICRLAQPCRRAGVAAALARRASLHLPHDRA